MGVRLQKDQNRPCFGYDPQILVDVDYDGDIFDMDRTVFAKDISDEGKIRMTGLT